MRRAAPLLLAILLAALAAAAPAREDDKGRLTRLLENTLSDAGREVTIEGFEGALGSEARIARLSVADSRGVWLEISDAVLNWNRTALLRGRLDVEQLAAARIVLTRPPEAGKSGAPAPEATPFRLPDLPVSIRIGRLAVDRLELGEAVLGTAAVLSGEGHARLADGEGEAVLTLDRIDDRRGRFALEGSFVNATRQLALDLSLSEGAGGIAATTLRLPGGPALSFAVEGAGPLDDFTAEIALSTEGTRRLSGAVTLAEDGAGTRFEARLSGDLRPLVTADYRPFLGGESRFAAAGLRAGDGALVLETLDLETDALRLTGAGALGGDGWPRRVDVSGQIAPPEGAPTVRLALPGAPTRLKGARFTLAYDRAAGDGWRGRLAVDGLSRPTLAISRAVLSGQGRLAPGAAGAPGQVTADIDARIEGLAPEDEGVARALGSAPSGQARIDWQAGGPVRLAGLAIEAAAGRFDGRAELRIAGGQTPRAALSGDGRLTLADLSALSGLAGRPLGGAARLTLSGEAELLSGAFDLTGEGTLDDPALEIAYLDPLLAGQSRLAVDARRDETGLTVETLSITAPAARLSASGGLAGEDGRAEGRLEITRPEVLWPGIEAPVAVAGTARMTGREIAFTLDGQGPGQAALTGTGTLSRPEGAPPRLSARGQLSVARLAAYQPMLGRPVVGAIDLTLAGEGTAEGAARAEVSGTGRDLSAGVAALDPLLAGQGTLDLAIAREPTGALEIERARFTTAALEAAASGPLAGPLDWRLGLDDLARLVPDLQGPVRAEGQLRPDQGGWRVAARASGPGGLTARAEGRAGAEGRLDIALSGTAPLALANAAIAPRLLGGQARFDLRLDGPPALSALSGNVSTAGATLVLPDAGLRLEAISADIGLAGSRATIEARARPAQGGAITASGGVALSAGLEADLAARLDQVVLARPGLLEAILSGRLAVRGPLAGGAALSGALTLERAEIRIPEGDLATAATLKGLEHRAPPPAVARSLERAGLTVGPEAGGAGVSRPWTLNIALSAPARLFIRGRGLDAEFGGRLVVAGTTAAPAPRGRFELIRGRLDLLGRRFALEQGFVQPQGGLVPRIGLTATAEAEEITARITIAGPADSPDLSLSSSPDLPEDEILARLLFGRTIQQVSPLQALRLAQAVRRLAGGGTGLTGKLRGGVGLDDLDVSQGADGAPTARAGKYLSENIYSDVTVDSQGRSEIRLNLDVSRSITVRGRQSSDGETGLGVFFEKDY